MTQKVPATLCCANNLIVLCLSDPLALGFAADLAVLVRTVRRALCKQSGTSLESCLYVSFIGDSTRAKPVNAEQLVVNIQ